MRAEGRQRVSFLLGCLRIAVRCLRCDLISPFVLITGTVITLILLMAGSVSLLYAINNQELPSILTGGISGGARKE